MDFGSDDDLGLCVFDGDQTAQVVSLVFDLDAVTQEDFLSNCEKEGKEKFSEGLLIAIRRREKEKRTKSLVLKIPSSCGRLQSMMNFWTSFLTALALGLLLTGFTCLGTAGLG